jgi:hypothetical protein
MSPADESVAKHRFRLAGRIDVGGIDEIDAGIEGSIDDLIDRRLIEAANHLPLSALSAKRHGAETELRDEDAGVRELSEFHGEDYIIRRT